MIADAEARKARVSRAMHAKRDRVAFENRPLRDRRKLALQEDAAPPTASAPGVQVPSDD